MTAATEPLKIAPGTALHRLSIPLDTICPSPCQPRKHFDPAALAELAESIKQHSVLEPILLRAWPTDYAHQPTPRPEYELVAGERRWRAAKLAGLTAIEAKILALTDEQMLEIQLIENLQRRDLTALEEADGYHRMVTDYHYSADKIAEKIGQSKSYVYGRLKLATLCHEGRKAFDAGKLDASKALLIARIPTSDLQEQALLEITGADFYGERMSYRRAAEHVQSRYMLKLTEAPFPPNDADLVPTAGKCKSCPKRSGNAGDLFSDVKNANVCTDPDCYQAKVKAHQAREIAKAREQGLKVITGKAAEKILPHGVDYEAKEGMIALDSKTWVGGEQKTYRELVGQEVQPSALVEDKKSGAMVPVVEKKQIAEALKAAGIAKGSDLHDQQQKENEKKAKAETEYRRRLHDQVRAAIRTELEADPSLEPEELVMVARVLFERLWDDNRKKIAVLWTPDEGRNRQEKFEAFNERLDTLSRAELLLLLVDMAVIGETHVSHYSADSTPKKLLALAKHSNIDAAAIKKGVTAAAKKPQASSVSAAKKGKAGSAAAAGADESPAAANEVAQVPDTAKPTLKVQPKTANPILGGLQIGMRVRIKNDLRGPNNKLRKCCGREGVIEELPGDGAWVVVRTGPKKSDLVANLAWNEVEPVVETKAASAPVVKPKVGDRVHITGTKDANGKPHGCRGCEGEIRGLWALDSGATVRLDPGSPKAFVDVHVNDLAVLAAGASESAPPPTKAAPAGGVKRAEEAVPPVAKNALPPTAAWPFPTNYPAATQAARAGESKAKEKSSGRACPAERNEKTRKVRNAKPTGARPAEADTAVVRCDKTGDMFGGAQ